MPSGWPTRAPGPSRPSRKRWRPTWRASPRPAPGWPAMLPLPFSLEAKAAAALLAVAGVLGAVAWAAHHERQIGAAQCRAEVATASAAAASAALVESQRRVTAAQEVAHAADQAASAARSDADRAAAAARRLRDQLAARGGTGADDFAASAAGPADPTANVLGQCVERYRSVAAAADAAVIAGQACERAYRSLSVP
ncbi:MAG: DUF2514 family protein [Burkholderiales bacterium]|nr:MAG: DUF2514 family protein [Burkholderiales bacterium]